MKRSWKIFENEKEYNKALKRTIEIFHAEKGTPEGDELDVLLPLVLAYEELHYPIPAPDSKSLNKRLPQKSK